MKTDDLDRELRRLREAGERVNSNLVELEIDSSRQLLEARALSGESAARWAAASAALTELWEWRSAFDGFLERAQELRRSSRRADELRSLLSERSIELATSPVPLAERDLLGSAEVAVRCTPDELLERMSAAFDEVKVVVARFGQAWETLIPRVTAARAGLDRARELAASLGEAGRGDLNQANDRLARLSDSVSADPLSVAPADLERLTDSLEAIARDLEATAALRHDLDARLDASRRLLTELEATTGETRAAHEELLIKIAAPSSPAAPALPADFGSELERIVALTRDGAWREARRRLDAWSADARARLDAAEKALRANRAPIEARNQLRSLLEAYQVKAHRLGMVEDPQLERTFMHAHRALYTAPTDLGLAAQLVRRYQELVSTPHQSQEAVR